MKKIILSFVAFMAFSVNVYSNNIGLEEEIIEEKIEVIVEVHDDCWGYADLVECFCTGGSQGYDSFAIWQAAYEYCETW
jgi:hypothetical protein